MQYVPFVFVNFNLFFFMLVVFITSATSTSSVGAARALLLLALVEPEDAIAASHRDLCLKHTVSFSAVTVTVEQCLPPLLRSGVCLNLFLRLILALLRPLEGQKRVSKKLLTCYTGLDLPPQYCYLLRSKSHLLVTLGLPSPAQYCSRNMFCAPSIRGRQEIT